MEKSYTLQTDNSLDIEESKPVKSGISVMYGSLAVLSTIVGGGIVGIPFSVYMLGIPLAFVVNFATLVACQYSCKLYLEAAKTTGVPIKSIY